ncbi:hypothetical protein HNQ34_002306 [Anoxybacillus tepidamans]|uniref:Uncharacterized protein n=1 Tax=Anoxybacteroides tepidamans TaxID=265948 RepID=A0A7W8IR55_9BACL|nr:hypothetical protein [Anoxybacillus tepidamans]MBB5325206.1 hypothetical protein [Anoxybacillus tepidamans]
MAATAKRLYLGNPSTTLTTVYTVPVNTTTIVKSIVICNTSATDTTASIVISTAGIVYNMPIKGKDTVIIDMSLVMYANDTIQVQQGIANNLNITISGVEVA